MTEYTEEIIINKLARYMHEEYENAAKHFGWNTQEKYEGVVDDLPEANMRLMIHIAYKTIGWIIKNKEEFKWLHT